MEPEIQARIERLYENEALTDNLTDADAKTLLRWAEAQLQDNTDESLVTAAVSFANASDSADIGELLSQAQAFLTQQLHAHEITTARPATAADASPDRVTTTAPQPKNPLGVSGASGTTAETDTPINARAGASASPPARKKRRTAKRKSQEPPFCP